MVALMDEHQIEHVYTPYGAIDALWDCTDPEVLVDGPAGTGKSRGILEMVLRDAVNHPGSRQAIVRKTRVSLTDSALKTWERIVLKDVDSEYLTQPLMGGPTTATRHAYLFKNGSEVVCHGMDNPTRLFSTEYDRIYVQEATELTAEEWESLHRALRNNVMPYQQLLGDCNPDAEYHWLNQRMPMPGKVVDGRRRIVSRHTDNPSLTEDYLNRLSSNLTGVRRKRLFLGLWVAAEGQIWDNYDPSLHLIHGDMTQSHSTGRWHLWVNRWQQDIELTWFFGAMDWGFRNPGCMGIFGVDKDRRAFLVRQVYRSQRNHDWWAGEAESLRKMYDVQRFICDPEDAAGIDLFNQRMGKVGGYWIAVPAEKKPNDFGASAAIVRERFGSGGLYILSDSLQDRDPLLVEAKKPTCVEEEVPSYVYREIKDGQAVKEEPAPDSDDHGCDMVRYGMSFLDRNDWQPEAKKPEYRPGSFAKMLDHAKVWEKIRN